MQSKLFYGSLVFFCVGVGVDTVLPLAPVFIVWILFLGFVLALVWRKKSEAFFAPHLLFTSVLLVAFSLGLLRTEVASWQFGHSVLERSVGSEVSLTGVVSSEPEQRERTVQFFIQAETDKVLVSTDRLTPVSYGDEVIVSGKLERPEAFTTDLGRTFDYPGYLKAKGVEYRISFAEVETAGSGKGNFFITQLLAAKHIFVTTLQQVVPEPAVGLGTGLLLGVKSALGTDIEDDFRRTGIIHIVVLSGYNVMLVVAFILFCLSYVLPLHWRLLVAVLAIAAFALIVGLSATVVRASVMASLVLLAQFLGRRYNVLRALLFAGVVMLLVNPYLLIYDIGFQLSFMATLGLVLILPLFENRVLEGKGIGVREFFFSTVATQIAVLPLLVYHIGQVSLIALVVNVLVLPVVPLAMLLTFFTGVLGLFSLSIASVSGLVATYSLAYILFIASWFAGVPFAAIEVPAFSGWGVVGMYGLMMIGWLWWKRKNNTAGALGWTIEEEEVFDAGAGQGQAPASNTQDLPIFFR